MVNYVTKKYSMKQMLRTTHPLIKEWFSGRFDDLTPPQAMAVPLIARGRNVLVSSPTGSGKTLTAFLSILNDLFRRHEQGKLREGIHALYVSPLKALANDIDRNLREPLAEMRALAERRGVELPDIRVAVRSGDTPVEERARMVRRPPHILITTPESLGLIISTTRFREHLRPLRYLILDEIHDLASNKRGTHLSLSVERLSHFLGRDPVRIGLSATQAPIEEIAHYLGGHTADGPREVNVVEVRERKHLDLRVLCPVDDITAHPAEVVHARMYDLLAELVREHRTTLVFTNTRAGTEAVTLQLRERGIEKLAAHHGSLSRETRLEVEAQLKDGELDAVVSSTSLELGIDIGYLDLVVQIGSPKSIAKGLQRIGRAGHALHRVSKGRLIVFDADDLIECAVLVKSAYDGDIDRVAIPHTPLDVLAQSLVGMSLEQQWTADEALTVVRGAHPYHDLPRETFDAVLEFIGGQALEHHGVYPKVWYDPVKGEFGLKRGSRQIYNLNIGTIPQEISYRVELEEKGLVLGGLSEKFVEKLSRNDIFVLGGRTYQFRAARGNAVFVRDGLGRKPTVPSWSGEMLPRTFDLSEAVGRFRGLVAERLAEDESAQLTWLDEDYRLDPGAARTVLSHLREQHKLCGFVPSDRVLFIEGYVDNRGRKGAVFHFPFGRRVNDALARAFAWVLGRRLEASVGISLNDDAFMLTFPRRLTLGKLAEAVRPEALEPTLRRAIRATELFLQRFRHCANRALMVLRNYRGREISMQRQQLRASQVLESLHALPSFPVLEETYREILHDAFDLIHAREVLADIASGEREVRYRPYSAVPSPLAHGVILAGLSDIVLMEDRTALLRELHAKVLGRVVDGEGAKARFDRELVESYFNEKRPLIDSEATLREALRAMGALALLGGRGGARSVYELADMPRNELTELCRRLIEKQQVESVWTGDTEPLFALPEQVPLYRAVYDPGGKLPVEARKALTTLKRGRQPRRREALEALARAYRAACTADGWRSRDPPLPANYEQALDTLLGWQLAYGGPLTAEELALRLRIPVEVVSQALDELEEAGTLQGGNFVLGRPTPQYLLAEDVIYLDAQAHGRLEVVTERQLRAFLDRKLFARHDDMEALFAQYGALADVSAAFPRLKGDALAQWWAWRDDDRLLQGRFHNGRLRHVPAHRAGIYQALFRRDPEGPVQKAVVDLLTRRPPLTMQELTAALAKRCAAEEVQLAVRALEEKLQVHRYERSRSGWSRRNRYRRLPEFAVPDDPARELLLQTLRGIGPLAFKELLRETGLPVSALRQLLATLEQADEVNRLVVAGATRLFYYALADEIEALRAPVGAPQTRVLDWRDPMLTHVRREGFSRYGDVWTHAVTHGGALAGYLELWPMAGLIEVRDIVLAEPQQLAGTLAALSDYAAHHRAFHNDVIRLLRVDGTPVAELLSETLGVFHAAGYRRTRDWLVQGPVVTTAFDAEDIDAYLLWKQHIHPERRFPSAARAFREFGGLRSEFELSLRVQGSFYHPREYGDELELVLGIMIPSYATFCTVRDAMLYRDARDALVEPGDEVLIEAAGYTGVPREELMQRTGMDPDTFKAARTRLYRGLHLVRTTQGYYRSLPPEPRLKRDEARYRVVRRLVESFGLISAERLSALLKSEFPMHELRAILARLEREEVLVKGFLHHDEDSLVWLLKRDLRRIRGHRFRGSFVLHQSDRLSHYLAEEVRREFGLGACSIIYNGTRRTGAFKMKRRGKTALITRFVGGRHERHVLEMWARQWHLRVIWEPQAEEEAEAGLAAETGQAKVP